MHRFKMLDLGHCGVSPRSYQGTGCAQIFRSAVQWRHTLLCWIASMVSNLIRSRGTAVQVQWVPARLCSPRLQTTNTPSAMSRRPCRTKLHTSVHLRGDGWTYLCFIGVTPLESNGGESLLAHLKSYRRQVAFRSHFVLRYMTSQWNTFSGKPK